MASPTGTARMPTQGSWRPFVVMSVSAPLRSTVRRGDRIDDVGLTANRAPTGRAGAVAAGGAARRQDRRRRLARDPRHHRLAGGDATQNPAGVVGHEADALVAHPHLVGVFL